MPPLAEDLLLHERFAIAHVGAALDLARHEQRVDGLADIVRQPELFNHHLAGFYIDRHLRYAG